MTARHDEGHHRFEIERAGQVAAAEYRRDEELSSQAVFITTLLSAVTMAVLLAVVRR
jgi:predicted permease